MKKLLAVFLLTVTIILSLFGVSSLASEETPYVKGSEGIVSLEGKTIAMIGNSMFYYGNCTLYNKQGEADNGYLKQLTKLNGENTTILDYCYPGKSLNYTYVNHLSKEDTAKLAEIDYVVMSEQTSGSKTFVEDIQNIMSLFPETTKFYFACHNMMYENNVRTVIDNFETLRQMGVEIVNWGKLVYDIYTGAVEVPYALQTYTRGSFVKDNVGFVNGDSAVGSNREGDRKHPNPLAGYITALSVYTAITNRSAVIQEYKFTSDTSIHKYYNFNAFIETHYNGTVLTNFDKIFASAYDMAGLQRLINEYNEAEGRHALTLYEKGVNGDCTAYRTTDSYICVCCGEIIAPHREIAPLLSHNLSPEPYAPSTCDVNGSLAHYRCTNKGCSFISVDSEGKSPLASAVVLAMGHRTVEVAETKPDCDSDGNIFHYRCTVCAKAFSDKDATAELTDVIIPKTGHKTEYVPAVSATCTAKGTEEHFRCINEGCTALFADERADIRIFDVSVPAFGHTEAVIPAVSSTCTKTGLSEGMRCTVCSAVTAAQSVTQTVAHTFVKNVVPSTVSSKGTVSSKCTVCGFEEDKKTVSQIKTVKLKITSFLYGGEEKEVVAYIKDKKGRELDEGIDYDIVYLTDRKETGRHSVNIVFKDNYAGSKILTYKIVPDVTKRLTAKKTASTLTAQWQTVPGASAYRVIIYSSSGKKIKTGYTVKNTYKFKKLSKNTKYKIKVTAYKKADGKKLYSTESKTVAFRTLSK